MKDIYHLHFDESPTRKRSTSQRGAGFRNKRRRLIGQHKNKPVCGYCGQVILGTDITVEHIIPLSIGGSNAIENLVLACHKCNGEKGNRLRPVLHGPKKGSQGERKYP